MSIALRRRLANEMIAATVTTLHKKRAMEDHMVMATTGESSTGFPILLAGSGVVLRVERGAGEVGDKAALTASFKEFAFLVKFVLASEIGVDMRKPRWVPIVTEVLAGVIAGIAEVDVLAFVASGSVVALILMVMETGGAVA